MDPDNQQFEVAAVEFQKNVVLLEEKMTSIAGNALSDATTPLNAYRVVQLLGSFLERPQMMQKVRESFPRLVGLAMNEVLVCSDMLKGMPNASDSDNLVHSVQLIQQISKRARGHITACINLGIDFDVIGMRLLDEKHRHLETSTQQKMNQHLELWTAHMSQIAIDRPLFVLNEETGHVQSGADAAMARLVSECRILQQLLESSAVPVPAAWSAWTAIYESLNMKMKLVDIIVSCYASIETSLTPSTRQLLESRLMAIKEKIIQHSNREEQELLWTWTQQEENVTTELRSMAETTLRLHQSMKKFSSTSETITQISSAWSKTPIIDALEGLLPTGEQLLEIFNKRYAEYVAASKRMVLIVGECQQLMPDLQPTDWLTYLQMIDGLILEGLLKAVTGTYSHIIDISNKGYLYELQLNIANEGVCFQPPLRNTDTDTDITTGSTDNQTTVVSQSMVQQFEVLVAGISRVASSMTSLSNQIQFQVSVDENPTVIALRQELNSTISNAVTGVTTSVTVLEQYSFIWNTDPNVYLHNFLLHACLLGEYAPDNAQPCPATLQHFKQQLNQLSEWSKTIKLSIKDLEKVGRSFKLKLNVKPAIQVF